MKDDIKLPPLPASEEVTRQLEKAFPWVEVHILMVDYAHAAVEADRQQRGESVAVVDGDETGTWAEFVPGCDLVPGQELYTTPQPAESHVDRASRIVDSWPEWKRNYAITKHDVKPTQPATPAQEPSVPWENFPGYLIDHCEGEIISEEGLQHALSAMLQDPLYSDTTPAQEPSDDINIEDVREYLDAWGCLAHPGVVALLARYGNHHIEQPSVPDQALLISMATCLYHGFGLLDQGRQESMLHDMRKLWDEVMGRGYYTPSNRERYISMLAAAPKFGEEQ